MVPASTYGRRRFADAPLTSRWAGGTLAAALLLLASGCQSGLQMARSSLPSQQAKPTPVGLRSDAEYRAIKTPSAVAKSGGSHPVRQVGHTSGNC